MNQAEVNSLLLLEQNVERLADLLAQSNALRIEQARQIDALTARIRSLEVALAEQEKKNRMLSAARIIAADKESAYQIRSQITQMINDIDRGLRLLQAE